MLVDITTPELTGESSPNEAVEGEEVDVTVEATLADAFTVPAEARAALNDLQHELQRHPGLNALRWVRPEAIHITLKFLGERPSEPDVAAMGGRLLRSWSDRRLVAVPANRASELQALPGVSYIQRVWTGEPFGRTQL